MPTDHPSSENLAYWARLTAPRLDDDDWADTRRIAEGESIPPMRLTQAQAKALLAELDRLVEHCRVDYIRLGLGLYDSRNELTALGRAVLARSHEGTQRAERAETQRAETHVFPREFVAHCIEQWGCSHDEIYAMLRATHEQPDASWTLGELNLLAEVPDWAREELEKWKNAQP